MRLQEAIKEGTEEVKHPYRAKKMGRPDALKLLIEAGKLPERFNKYLEDYIGELETVPAFNDRHRGSLFCRLETLGLVKAAFNNFVKEIEDEE